MIYSIKYVKTKKEFLIQTNADAEMVVYMANMAIKSNTDLISDLKRAGYDAYKIKRKIINYPKYQVRVKPKVDKNITIH